MPGEVAEQPLGLVPGPDGEGLQWEEVILDISAYAGKEVELLLTCSNEPGHSTVADWLNWRDIQLVSPHFGGNEAR